MKNIKATKDYLVNTITGKSFTLGQKIFVDTKYEKSEFKYDEDGRTSYRENKEIPITADDRAFIAMVVGFRYIPLKWQVITYFLNIEDSYPTTSTFVEEYTWALSVVLSGLQNSILVPIPKY